jgi:hypothetical protein
VLPVAGFQSPDSHTPEPQEEAVLEDGQPHSQEAAEAGQVVDATSAGTSEPGRDSSNPAGDSREVPGNSSNPAADSSNPAADTSSSAVDASKLEAGPSSSAPDTSKGEGGMRYIDSDPALAALVEQLGV